MSYDKDIGDNLFTMMHGFTFIIKIESGEHFAKHNGMFYFNMYLQ